MNNPIPMMELDRTENALRDILIQPLITPNEVGLLEVPTKPGLGIEVDETALNKYRSWINTSWVLETGDRVGGNSPTFAEISPKLLQNIGCP